MMNPRCLVSLLFAVSLILPDAFATPLPANVESFEENDNTSGVVQKRSAYYEEDYLRCPSSASPTPGTPAETPGTLTPVETPDTSSNSTALKHHPHHPHRQHHHIIHHHHIHHIHPKRSIEEQVSPGFTGIRPKQSIDIIHPK